MSTSIPIADHANDLRRRMMPTENPSAGEYPRSESANENEPSLVPMFAGIKNIALVRKSPKIYTKRA